MIPVSDLERLHLEKNLAAVSVVVAAERILEPTSSADVAELRLAFLRATIAEYRKRDAAMTAYLDTERHATGPGTYEGAIGGGR